MAKTLMKDNRINKNPINYTSNTPAEYPTPRKSRQQIYQENYQKNKERKKQQRRERYYRQKELAQQTDNKQLSKYYEAEAIKVLMSFAEYVELNQEKRQIWEDFNWTLKTAKKAGKEVI